MMQLNTKKIEEMVERYLNSDRVDNIEVTGERVTITAWLSKYSHSWKCSTCNTGSDEFEEFIKKDVTSKEDLVLLLSIVDMRIEDIQKFYEDLYKVVKHESVPYDDCYSVKEYELFSDGDLILRTFLLVKQYISTVRCAWCGKEMTQADSLVLKHEYGAHYCSYKCLCEGGFYGHWSRTSLETALEENKKNIL